MPQLLLSKLRRTLAQLQPLTTASYSPKERKTLRSLLATTISTLRALYPDHLSAEQKHSLLQNLSLLEQQSTQLTAARTENPTGLEWHAINSALHAAIVSVLPEQLPAPSAN